MSRHRRLFELSLSKHVIVKGDLFMPYLCYLKSSDLSLLGIDNFDGSGFGHGMELTQLPQKSQPLYSDIWPGKH